MQVKYPDQLKQNILYNGALDDASFQIVLLQLQDAIKLLRWPVEDFYHNKNNFVKNKVMPYFEFHKERIHNCAKHLMEFNIPITFNNVQNLIPDIVLPDQQQMPTSKFNCTIAIQYSCSDSNAKLNMKDILHMFSMLKIAQCEENDIIYSINELVQSPNPNYIAINITLYCTKNITTIESANTLLYNTLCNFFTNGYHSTKKHITINSKQYEFIIL